MNLLRISIWLGIVGLAACSPEVQDEQDFEEPVYEAPVLVEPVAETPVLTPEAECSTEDIGGGDGIGGTGCPID